MSRDYTLSDCLSVLQRRMLGGRRLIHWTGGGMIFAVNDIESQLIACKALLRIKKAFRFKRLTRMDAITMPRFGKGDPR